MPPAPSGGLRPRARRTPPEVGVQHARVGTAPRPACRCGDDGAELQHRDAVGQVHDELHVVLHHQDAQPLGAQLVEQRGQRAASPGGAGRPPARRAAAPRAGPPARARSRPRAAGPAPASRPARRRARRGRSARSAGAPRPAARPPRRGPAAASRRSSRAGRAGARRAPRSRARCAGRAGARAGRCGPGRSAAKAREGLPVIGSAHQPHLALGRIVDARDHVEEGALAGAVRADQRMHLAGLHVHRDRVVGDQAAEALGHVVGLEQRPAPRGGSVRLRERRQALGAARALRRLQEARATAARASATGRRRSAAARTASAGRTRSPRSCRSRPSSFGRMSCSCSFSSVISVAPSTAPHRWPAPPTTAMNRYSMPMLRLKGVGLTKRCRCA